MSLPSLGALKAVVLDIEGTTTPISFVFNILFPYARQHLSDYLSANRESPELQSIVQEFSKQLAAEGSSLTVDAHFSSADWVAQATAAISLFIDEDRKFGPLKTLQGQISEAGYVQGSLKGQLFPEVAQTLQRWQQQGLKIAIYSSGSRRAQQLLFGYSEAGDLTELLSGYFDTAVGAKGESTSYQRIAEELGFEPQQLLFLTDILGEAQAAHQAGWHTAIMLRPGNRPQGEHSFATYQTFDEIG